IGERMAPRRVWGSLLRVVLSPHLHRQLREHVARLQVPRGGRLHAVPGAHEHAVVTGGPDRPAQVADLADLADAMTVDAPRPLPGAAFHEALGRALELGVQLVEAEGLDAFQRNQEALSISLIVPVDEFADLDQLGPTVVTHQDRRVAGDAR